MKTTIEKAENKVIVTLEGSLDSYVSEEVGKEFKQLYDLENTEIILDCKNLDYIASNGLRLFFILLRSVGPKGCQVIIKDANKMLMKVFELTGFVNFYKFI